MILDVDKKPEIKKLKNKSQKTRYSLKQQPFIISNKFKRELPINKNIFQLNEPDPKNYKKIENVQVNEISTLIPLNMSIAIIKLLLVQKIIAYCCIFSILMELCEEYYVTQQEIEDQIIIFQMGITLVLFTLLIFDSHLQYQNNKVRIIQGYSVVEQIFKFALILISPNVWIHGTIFQLIIIFRIYFPLSYYVKQSVYYSPRAARILNFYGLKTKFTFLFALKVIINDLKILQVLFIYICVVMIYSHCLYIVSHNIDNFLDCFQIVIVTLPTVGYGQYDIIQIFPRLMIILILITGFSLNAFVTLTILKNFQMTDSENNSYLLMQKLKMIEDIEQISSKFITDKVRSKILQDPNKQKQLNEVFKQTYRQYKNKYSVMRIQDSNNQVSMFKDSLQHLKIKIFQTNNMINVLLIRLLNKNKLKKIINQKVQEVV